VFFGPPDIDVSAPGSACPASGRHVPVLDEPFAGAPRITAPSQLCIEQVEQRTAEGE
jgi:hypothetical protein